MLSQPEFREKARLIVGVARTFHARGWCLATSGNFSCRLDAACVAITISGRDKGRLEDDDVMVVDLEGRALAPEDARPSAETPLHVRLYAREERVGAVFHVHSPAATVLSRERLGDGAVRLSGWEMQKAFAGVETHESEVIVPIFANDQDTHALAQRVQEWMDQGPPIHGYLIAGHGLHAWGRDAGEAARHVEAMEFLLDCEQRRTAK